MTNGDAEGGISLLLESGEFAAFLKQRKTQRLTLPIFAANTIPFDLEVQRDLSLADGVTYFDYITSGTPDFFKRYEERFKSAPGVGSAKAYDAIYLISEAMKKCGVERSQVRECLLKTKLSGVSGSIEFDSQGVLTDLTSNAKLLAVVNGKVVAAN